MRSESDIKEEAVRILEELCTDEDVPYWATERIAIALELIEEDNE